MVISEGQTSINACSICGSCSLECAIELPRFPLTGIFVDEKICVSEASYFFDQALLVCRDCSHMQLTHLLSPEVLYGESYAHRSSGSHLASKASDYLVQYIKSLTSERQFNCVLEIGCNDLVLLEKLKHFGHRVVGVDPIWRDRNPIVNDNMSVIGDFVEQVDFEKELNEKPDLIVSAHNLEHLHDPLGQISRLMDSCSDDALFVIEVPDAGLMIDNLRFDQVFHQHAHYFTLKSFCRLIEECGGSLVDFNINYRNWGGSLIVAFSKNKREETRSSVVTAESINKYSYDKVTLGFSRFQQRMDCFMQTVDGMDENFWGYGAGQMVPSVAYHLGCDLSFLKGIIDDDMKRHGLYYPYHAPQICDRSACEDIEDCTIVITALDGVRAIFSRLRDFDPRFVMSPIEVF